MISDTTTADIAVGFLKNCKMQLNVSIDILWELCSAKGRVVSGCTMKFWTLTSMCKIRLLWATNEGQELYT